MAKRVFHSTVFLLLALLPVLFFSCHKNDRELNPELQSSRDLSLSLSSWNDIFRQTHIFATSFPDLNPNSPPTVNTTCANLSVSPALPNTSFPKTLTINFGSVNCQCPDGASRRGQILATFSGPYWDSLTVITITPINYFINDNQVVRGTYTITNKGRNKSGNICFAHQISSGDCRYKNGKIVHSSTTLNWELTAGNLTPDVWDDQFLISGKGSGITSEGNAYTMAVNQRLLLALACPWMESGNLYLMPAGLSNRFIDLGTGTCSNKAAIWIFEDKYLLNQY